MERIFDKPLVSKLRLKFINVFSTKTVTSLNLLLIPYDILLKDKNSKRKD